jgi:hypothetical protein
LVASINSALHAKNNGTMSSSDERERDYQTNYPIKRDVCQTERAADNVIERPSGASLPTKLPDQTERLLFFCVFLSKNRRVTGDKVLWAERAALKQSKNTPQGEYFFGPRKAATKLV